MSPEESDRLWIRSSIGVVVGVLAFGMLSGFVIMPVVQGAQAGIDPWTAICRALGIAPGSPAVQQPAASVGGVPVSNVVWSPQVLNTLSSAPEDAGREIAVSVCAACHGENGVSTDPAQFPNMAGQSSAAIYKQLHDYKSGARTNDTMQSIVQELSDTQMAEVAAYYARRARPPWDVTWVRTSGPEADRLARTGDSARGLPACESCHSPAAGGPLETPVLFSQTPHYLAAQMRAFKSGERRSDLFGRMRDVAGKLSEREIDLLAQYYSEMR